MRAVLLLIALAAAAAGCGGSSKSASEGPACPSAWKDGWQRLADDVGAPVYCPSWVPHPIDGEIDGRYKNGRWVDEQDKSYLVSLLWVDQDGGVSREVHVNFRGYPGSTEVPMCEETLTAGGKTTRKPIPCFSDERGTKRIGDVEATVYSVNQGIDAWHVLYAWERDGSLYTVSQHVAEPYSYQQVVRNIERMIRGLALLEPSV